MPFFSWREAFSVGIVELDQQHKRLIDLGNQLYEAMRAGGGSLEIQPLLVRLIEYSKFHFRSEEQRMLQARYPGYVRHRAAHEAFKSQIRNYYAQVNQNQWDRGISLELGNFLKRWLLDHILKEDRSYAPYVVRLDLKKGETGGRVSASRAAGGGGSYGGPYEPE